VLLDPAGRERYDQSLLSLAAAVAGEPLPVAGEAQDWRRLTTAAIAVVAVLLVLFIGASTMRAPDGPPQVRFPGVPQPAFHEDWEPLATYAYESHLSIPPVPFPEPASTEK
jgi:hypothetical protein